MQVCWGKLELNSAGHLPPALQGLDSPGLDYSYDLMS